MSLEAFKSQKISKYRKTLAVNFIITAIWTTFKSISKKHADLFLTKENTIWKSNYINQIL